MRVELRCYVCGETINPRRGFVLASMSESTDRVFVVEERCEHRLDECGTVLVKEANA